MAEMTPVSFKARDGLEIRGFLTLPQGSGGKNLPLIVHPHGGPFGPYDDWSFDPEVQLLANRGYAVLQVNFRGSGNYGARSSARATSSGAAPCRTTSPTPPSGRSRKASPTRTAICIYGASYGAYASAMGAAKEPDLYKCAVGYVGVYDMGMMYSHGDIQRSNYGTNFLKEALGERAVVAHEDGGPDQGADVHHRRRRGRPRARRSTPRPCARR
jgi:predicted acyl esterase